MSTTVIVKGKKKVIGKAIPVILKQAERSAKVLSKTVSDASNKQNARVKTIRSALELVDKKLAKLKDEARIVNDRVRYIGNIDREMNTLWPGWYESGEKLWNKKKDDKDLVHADKEVKAAEKRALSILKHLQDECASIGNSLDKLDAAVKGLIDKAM